MSRVFLALMLLFSTSGLLSAQTGDAQAGKTAWDSAALFCKNCHGAKGEGGFGPDLAGRHLTAEQFKRAVRQPWGIMPAFVETQVDDKRIGDLVAFFDSMPKVADPGPWRVPLTPGVMDTKQLITSYGCAQCHGAELANMRRTLGAIVPEYALFSRIVYEHTNTMAEVRKMMGEEGAGGPLRMGNFSKLRLPDPILQEIFRYISTEMGFRVPITARLSEGKPEGSGVAYTLTVENTGLPGKAATAEDVSVSLTLEPGATIVSTSDNAAVKSAEGVTLKLPRLAPKEKQTYTITVSGGAATPAIKGGMVSWPKPAFKDGSGDKNPVVMPPPPKSTGNNE